MRLALNVGIKIRVKVKKCVSQSFQAIVSRVGNDFNRSTVQLQRCKPRLDQIHWIVHSSIKQRPRSTSTLQFIDSVLQSPPRRTQISLRKYFPDPGSSGLLTFPPLKSLTEEFCCEETFPLLHLLSFSNFSIVSSSPELSSSGQYTLTPSSLSPSGVFSTISETTWRVKRR